MSDNLRKGYFTHLQGAERIEALKGIRRAVREFCEDRSGMSAIEWLDSHVPLIIKRPRALVLRGEHWFYDPTQFNPWHQTDIGGRYSVPHPSFASGKDARGWDINELHAIYLHAETNPQDEYVIDDAGKESLLVRFTHNVITHRRVEHATRAPHILADCSPEQLRAAAGLERTAFREMSAQALEIVATVRDPLALCDAIDATNLMMNSEPVPDDMTYPESYAQRLGDMILAAARKP